MTADIMTWVPDGRLATLSQKFPHIPSGRLGGLTEQLVGTTWRAGDVCVCVLILPGVQGLGRREGGRANSGQEDGQAAATLN